MRDQKMTDAWDELSNLPPKELIRRFYATDDLGEKNAIRKIMHQKARGIWDIQNMK